MIYRRLASPLHAARPAVAVCWCGALALAALLQQGPVTLGALMLAVMIVAPAARIGRPMRRALRYAIPFALMICVINALVVRDGLTVIWRFGNLPVLGQTDVTLEATVYGAVLGLRAATLVLIGFVYSLCVDPDGVLALLRPRSFSSALTATIATRMVPILLRDARRLSEAQRTRSGPRPGRVALLRATTAGVLDRALDVAATLEVRGYALGGRTRDLRAPVSRHDVAFSVSAGAVLALALAARIAGWAPFSAYPSLQMPVGASTLLVAAGMLLCVLAPFADRYGIEP